MTAELAPISVEDAERLSQRIGLRLESMADSWAGALPLIREAIDREAFRALGYRSHGDFIADRFGNALSKLGLELRREVTRELSDAGLSTRAIAAATGTSHMTVKRDLARPAVTGVTPAPERDIDSEEFDHAFTGDPIEVDPSTGEVIESPRVEEHSFTEKRKVTTGIDGKTYKRPEPRAPQRRPLIDEVRKARDEIYSGLSRLQAVVTDDRFNKNKADIEELVAPVIRLANEVLPDFE